MTLPDLGAVDLRALREAALHEVLVAVVDTGVDATHPALAARVAGAMYIEERIERDAVGDDTPARIAAVRHPVAPGTSNDVSNHGTGVAGVVALTAPNARLLDVRVFCGARTPPTLAVIEGIRAAIESDARVINLSVTLPAAYRRELHEACEVAYRHNKIVVAAARNFTSLDGDYGYPAELSTCVSVESGGLEHRWALRFLPGGAPMASPMEFMAWGRQVEVPAPGGLYQVRDGTSFAAPAVSGMCALLLGARPGLRPFEVKALLKAAAVARDG